jgi:transcriptional regulator with XRE-family HTH domain
MKVESFPMLVHHLIMERHHGNARDMATATGLPYTTVLRWERGESREYGLAGIARFCAFYTLPIGDILKVINDDGAKWAIGERPASYMEPRRRGPKPLAPAPARRSGRGPRPLRGANGNARPEPLPTTTTDGVARRSQPRRPRPSRSIMSTPDVAWPLAA